MNYLVLLSGGLDSTVNLYKAHQLGAVGLALTIDYGQLAAGREIQCSQKLCRKLGIPHRVVELSFLADLGSSALTNKAQLLPTRQEVVIDDLAQSQKTADRVWVPNRNGLFLNVAACFAEALGIEAIVPGFNLEEAQTFPDNSSAFLAAMDQSLGFSTRQKVRTQCFTDQMSKPAIAKLGQELGVNWNDIWPCYQAGENWCRECESCQRSLRAIEMLD